ncbi:SDR family NAD(P)-dependent oxidoreductase [Afifella pfennigii]|uniref:SDR family NAD(P)-dependent oxidoreductase n=1 Tax=Afifella pfennigii TaxID=209897 RepID=UPI0009FE9F1A|nr:SDR family oxidoreductase [Afifella pfennigii]
MSAPAASCSALVTGASSGIGHAIAELLLHAGWQVDGIDRQASALPAATGYAHLKADLADPEELAALTHSLGGKAYTGFVHCAGIMRADVDAATWKNAGAGLWALHVGAAARLAAALAPRMPQGRGRIVFLSSRAAGGRAGRSLYAASKAALNGLARSLALDLLARGITVNVVAPAATDTAQLRDPRRAGAAVRPLPFGRLIAPEEVAATVAFLLGAEAGAITGQTIVQCGGASLAGYDGSQPAGAACEPMEAQQ